MCVYPDVVNDDDDDDDYGGYQFGGDDGYIAHECDGDHCWHLKHYR